MTQDAGEWVIRSHSSLQALFVVSMSTTFFKNKNIKFENVRLFFSCLIQYIFSEKNIVTFLAPVKVKEDFERKNFEDSFRKLMDWHPSIKY